MIESEQRVAVEYGVPSFVVTNEVFEKNHMKSPAFVAGGQIYFRENIDEAYKGKLAEHEINHVMKQVGYQPYLDFVDSVPERLNIRSEEFQKIANQVAKHTGIDPLNMTAAEQIRFYDELNATIYSHIAVNDTTILEAIRPAFVDLDAYVADIQGIHEQFKESRSVDPLLMQTALDAVDTQDQIRQWEDEFSQWNRQTQLQQARPALERLAGQYNDANTAQAFVQGYDGGLPLNVYQRGFDQVYQMAQQGYSLADVMSQADHHMLTTEQADLAYQAGAAERKSLPNGGGSGRLDEESFDYDTEDRQVNRTDTPDYVGLSRKLEQKLNDEIFTIIRRRTAEEANNYWAKNKYANPPVAEGSTAFIIKPEGRKFARVYSSEWDNFSGRWLLRAEDIEGLSAAEIAEKYALPKVPDMICDVILPDDIEIEVSVAGGQEQWNNSLGGNVQYGILTQQNKEWFVNKRPLT